MIDLIADLLSISHNRHSEMDDIISCQGLHEESVKAWDTAIADVISLDALYPTPTLAQKRVIVRPLYAMFMAHSWKAAKTTIAHLKFSNAYTPVSPGLSSNRLFRWLTNVQVLATDVRSSLTANEAIMLPVVGRAIASAPAAGTKGTLATRTTGSVSADTGAMKVEFNSPPLRKYLLPITENAVTATTPTASTVPSLIARLRGAQYDVDSTGAAAVTSGSYPEAWSASVDNCVTVSDAPEAAHRLFMHMVAFMQALCQGDGALSADIELVMVGGEEPVVFSVPNPVEYILFDWFRWFQVLNGVAAIYAENPVRDEDTNSFDSESGGAALGIYRDPLTNTDQYVVDYIRGLPAFSIALNGHGKLTPSTGVLTP